MKSIGLPVVFMSGVRAIDRQNVVNWTKDSGFLPWAQVLALLLIPRIVSASYNLIHDTDETYNYWEPLHFLVHGEGFQTWEYSPVYAIRSWAYIVIHSLPLLLVKSFITKEQQFYFLRGILGVLSALTESYLVTSVADVLGKDIAILTLAGLFCSTGMFNASTAFLPSSFTMYTSTLGLALSLRKKYFQATVAFAVGTVIGWPFSIILFAPLVAASLLEDYFPIFSFLRGFMVALQVLLVSTILDFKYYRIWTLVPLNIVLYNVFSSRDGRGPDLFGTEPATYYVKNLILNFNVLTLFALISLPLTLASGKSRMVRIKAISGFVVWFMIFTAQAHKEERFMYPAYPALVLASSIGLISLLELFSPLIRRIDSVLSLPSRAIENIGKYFIMFLSFSASIFRIYSMVVSYSAPLHLFPSLPTNKNYCIAGDWYRFPTSFLLPENTTISFVESDFKGLLPGKFAESWDAPIGMNDRNIWSADKVVSSSECDCLVDWKPEASESHKFYFLDRETGTKKAGFYGFDCILTETPADRLNRIGEDLFGRKLDGDGKRFSEGKLDGAIQRPAGW